MQVVFVFASLMGFIIADRNQIDLSVDESGNIMGISSLAHINKVSGQPNGKGDLTQVIKQMQEIMEKIRQKNKAVKGQVMASALAQKNAVASLVQTKQQDPHIDALNTQTETMQETLNTFHTDMESGFELLLRLISNASSHADNTQDLLDTCNENLRNMTALRDACTTSLAECEARGNNTQHELDECHNTTRTLIDQTTAHNESKTHFCQSILRTAGPWYGFLSQNFRDWTSSGNSGMTNLPSGCDNGAMSTDCFGPHFTTEGFCTGIVV